MLPPTVYIVDDEEPVRDAISFLLSSRSLITKAFSGGEALLRYLETCGAANTVPGCFLLDIRMEPLTGAATHDALLARGFSNPVLFLSGHGDIPMAVEALKKGAFDFLEKPTADNTLAERIEQALAVDQASRVQNQNGEERRARLASLSEREREVMFKVAAGKLNKIIADELHVSVRTVEVHRAKVFAKLGVKSAPEVATILAGG
jgi:two-component system, LuxR family, response regulator DctR